MVEGWEVERAGCGAEAVEVVAEEVVGVGVVGGGVGVVEGAGLEGCGGAEGGERVGFWELFLRVVGFCHFWEVGGLCGKDSGGGRGSFGGDCSVGDAKEMYSWMIATTTMYLIFTISLAFSASDAIWTANSKRTLFMYAAS